MPYSYTPRKPRTMPPARLRCCRVRRGMRLARQQSRLWVSEAMVDSTLNVNLLDEAEGFGLPLWFLSDADFDKLMSVTKPRQEILDGIERDN